MYIGYCMDTTQEPMNGGLEEAKEQLQISPPARRWLRRSPPAFGDMAVGSAVIHVCTNHI